MVSSPSGPPAGPGQPGTHLTHGAHPHVVPRHPRLDPLADRYAARTHGMKTSEIRALFSVVSRPEVVSLAGGMPAVTALPLDAVGSMIGELVSGMGAQTLQYGSGQGDPRLRERICDVMALEGITDASPSEVVVTVGSQQGLDLVTRVFCDPGDVILAEGPSYVGALGVFQAAAGPGPARRHGRRRADPRGAGGGAGRVPGQRRPGEVPLHGAQLPQPGRRDALRAAPRGDHGHRRAATTC